IIERFAFAQLHEQHNPDVAGRSIGDLLTNRHTLDDLRQLLHLPVDLRGSYPDAGGVQSCVAPAVDDHSIVCRYLAPVSVSPDTGVFLEIRSAIFRSVGIIPEPGRPADERPGAD